MRYGAMVLVVCVLAGCVSPQESVGQLEEMKAAWNAAMLSNGSRTNELLQELIDLQRDREPTPADIAPALVADEAESGPAKESPEVSPEALEVSTDSPEAGADGDERDSPTVENAGADESPEEPGLVETPGTDAGHDSSGELPVYAIRFPDGSGGSAVAVGGALAVTAAHVGSGSGEIEIDGKWIPCRATPVPGLDVAWVHIKDDSIDLPTIPFADLEYGQVVSLYGLRTKQRQFGSVVNVSLGVDITRGGRTEKQTESVLALEADGPGIDKGDSGGAVVDDQGRLVGVISAYNGTEKRHVSIAPVSGLDAVAAATAAHVPKLTVYSAWWCGYCRPLERAIKAGEFADFEVEVIKEEQQGLPSDVRKLPAIRYTDKDGQSQLMFGYGSGTLARLKQVAH